MQQLEKILEEIEVISLGKYYIEIEKIKDIIRKYMAGKDNNVHTNDGEERLKELKNENNGNVV